MFCSYYPPAGSTAAQSGDTIRQYQFERSGEGYALALKEVPRPAPGPGQVLVRVRAASLNDRDLNQLNRDYDPGYDLAGNAGGMLSEIIVTHEDGLVTIPEHLSWEEAATLPCAALTASVGLFKRGGLQPGQWVLLEGTSGVSVFGLLLAITLADSLQDFNESTERPL